MPTPTYFNLPEQKGQRILDIAVDEFSKAHFNDVSINQLIKRAQISRGSFYQYFEDLNDLYQYIAQIISQTKMDYMQEYLQNENTPFFEMLYGLYSTGLTFAREHPKYAKIGNFLMKGDPIFKQQILGDQEVRTKAFFIKLLQSGQDKGEIRSDIDINTAAFLFYQMNMSISDYYLTGTTWFEDTDQYMDAVDEMIKIFKQGTEVKEE